MKILADFCKINVSGICSIIFINCGTGVHKQLRAVGLCD